MWMSAALVTLLSLNLGQAGELKIANERLTYGHLGPTRPDNKYLPGDVVYLGFEVQNMTFGTNGKASYTIALEIADPKGTELLKQKPRQASAQNYLGGTTLPAAANLAIPLEMAPGTYTLRVLITDSASSKSVKVERKIEVVPPAFGLIQIGTSADQAATIPWSPVGVVGDSIYFNFSAVGFARDKSGQPNVKVSMQVLDDKGQSTKGTKLTGEATTGIATTLKVVPMQFAVTFNRAGTYSLELTATDGISGQTSKVTFPVRVLTP